MAGLPGYIYSTLKLSPLVSCCVLNQFSHFTNLLSLMAKRIKLKLSRVIPSLKFCRKTSVETPLTAIYGLSPVNSKVFDIRFRNSLPAPPPSTPVYPFPKGHISSKKVISVECGCRSGSCTQDLFTDGSFPRYKWKKEAARCHVVSKEPNPCRKIHDASSSDDVSPIWVNKNKKQSQTNKKQQKTLASVFSRDIGCFSSEEDASKETEALISISRSFSNESSFELDHSLGSTTDRFYNGQNGRKNKKVITTNIKKIRRKKRYNSKNYKGSLMAVSSPETESPPKTSVLRRVLPCTVDGKLRGSVAVVKKSVDPYEDFKRSMLEMILKKQIFEGKDLEELLQCFLSLNSRNYHGIIVEAFSEIWQVLFCDFPGEGRGN